MPAPSISITHHGTAPSTTKMIISPPRLNLRRAASYNAADKGPLSSTSSRFGFEHLAFSSPPPSPGLPLPQQAPRSMRRKTGSAGAPRPSRVIRCLLWLAATALLFYLASKAILRTTGGHVVSDVLRGTWAPGQTTDGDGDDEYDEYEMVGQDDLPDFPTPIMITDRRGKAMWTVSIPPTYEFPLTTGEYIDICAKCREVAARVHALHSRRTPVGIEQIAMMKKGTGLSGGDSSPGDRYFLDVHAAQEQHYLPGNSNDDAAAATTTGKGAGKNDMVLGADGNSRADKKKKPLCATSLTFVLETDDAGLGKTLMQLWLAYGLAQREGRAFFVDDSRWAYGDYTSIFEPPPSQGCRPPPAHEMLPCPRAARHLVVSSANARDIFFGGRADDGLEDAEVPLDRQPAQRELYTLARAGYEALFRLTRPDREHVFDRVNEHKMRTLAVEGPDHNGRVVGVHVRHGDRHPLEFQYADSYVPLSEYARAAQAVLSDGDEIARRRSVVVLASDDPLVYEADEFAGAVRAQELIRLAGKGEVDKDGAKKEKPPKNVMHKFTDETFGWEGGFFAAMFWNLGMSSSVGTGSQRQQASEETERLRSLVGRAYLMDLAVLADMTSGPGGGVVCAVSAMGCRLLAVMMGAERAFERGEWRNVDGGFGWSGVAW